MRFNYAAPRGWGVGGDNSKAPFFSFELPKGLKAETNWILAQLLRMLVSDGDLREQSRFRGRSNLRERIAERSNPCVARTTAVCAAPNLTGVRWVEEARGCGVVGRVVPAHKKPASKKMAMSKSKHRLYNKGELKYTVGESKKEGGGAGVSGMGR